MDRKLGFLAASVGSIIGGYIPSLFGAGVFSVWVIFTSAIGGGIGLWLAYRFSG